MNMDKDEIRKMFPALSEKVYGKDLVYLDNAATSQRALSVVDKWVQMSTQTNANIHRAVHALSVKATEEYEAARDAVKEFIGAADRSEIVFTSGTTASINLVAFSFGERFVGEGDEIIVTEEEHHSNIVPWQMLCSRKKAELRVVKVADDGYLDLEHLKSLLSPKTRIVAVAHISNVLGIINPVKEIVDICHAKGVPVLVDGAQGIVHCGVNVQDLDCDFYAFSGHKIYAATGTGVLYGKKKWLDEMPPYMGGGEMIETVTFEGTTYARSPQKFEAGTQNIAGAPTLIPAIETARILKENEDDSVLKYVLDALMKDERITLYGVPRGTNDKVPVFSFSVKGAHHEDLALILDKMGIAVRSGQMCAEPLMDRLGVTGLLRASFAPYNTLEEAQYFIKSLDRAINMLI